MITRIKIISGGHPNEFEAKVNEFCTTHDVTNIQYAMCLNKEGAAWHSCCILYQADDTKRDVKTLGQEDDL